MSFVYIIHIIIVLGYNLSYQLAMNSNGESYFFRFSKLYTVFKLTDWNVALICYTGEKWESVIVSMGGPSIQIVVQNVFHIYSGGPLLKLSLNIDTPVVRSQQQIAEFQDYISFLRLLFCDRTMLE